MRVIIHKGGELGTVVKLSRDGHFWENILWTDETTADFFKLKQ